MGAPPRRRRAVWLTFVTVGELAKRAEVRRWGAPRRARLETWLAGRPVIPYDPGIAHKWGELAGAAPAAWAAPAAE